MIDLQNLVGCRSFWQAQLRDSQIVIGNTTRSIVETTIDALSELIVIKAKEENKVTK